MVLGWLEEKALGKIGLYSELGNAASFFVESYIRI